MKFNSLLLFLLFLFRMLPRRLLVLAVALSSLVLTLLKHLLKVLLFPACARRSTFAFWLLLLSAFFFTEVVIVIAVRVVIAGTDIEFLG